MMALILSVLFAAPLPVSAQTAETDAEARYQALVTAAKGEVSAEVGEERVVLTARVPA